MQASAPPEWRVREQECDVPPPLLMETPDQSVHRDASANGRLTPLFLFRIECGAAAPHPAKLSQLDRLGLPLNPPGDFSPPVPPGERGVRGGRACAVMKAT
jgi:hypothetical protein